MVMKGRLMSLVWALESSIFAFSAASLTRWMACVSFERSMPVWFLNSWKSQFITAWSTSSPPSIVSPLVAFTSKTPSPMSSTEMSKVPPPKS